MRGDGVHDEMQVACRVDKRTFVLYDAVVVLHVDPPDLGRGYNWNKEEYTMSKKPALPDNPENHLVVFQEKAIRRTWYNEEWWFAVADVVVVLTDSVNPGDYIKKIRLRDSKLSQGWGQIATPLRIETAGGVQRVNCANTEGLFRIIQSIPSPKAEPFKRWLAQVGYERVKEIENPELASARARELYQAKGYPQAWIEKRLRSISIRGELTDEWKARNFVIIWDRPRFIEGMD